MRAAVKLRLIPSAPGAGASPAGERGLDLLATAVVMLDASRRAIYANLAAENLFELSRRKFAGHTLDELFGRSPSLDAAIDKAIATGASYTEQDL